MASDSFGPTLSAVGSNALSSSVAAMPETRRLVLKQGLDSLFTKPYFDVCQLDAIMKIVDAPEKGQAYQLLRVLHCVHYNTMEPALRDKIPQLVNECLRPPQVTVVATETAMQGVEI